jgi:hypothetical protein
MPAGGKDDSDFETRKEHNYLILIGVISAGIFEGIKALIVEVGATLSNSPEEIIRTKPPTTPATIPTSRNLSPCLNAPVTLYHATVGPHAANLGTNGVRLSMCTSHADFGRGFYTTRIWSHRT